VRWIGLGVEGEEGAEAGTLAGAEASAKGLNPLGDVEGWDVLDDIPNGSAAALILLEHHWAVGLRDAVMRAGGFRLSDGFISPLDLIEVGLISAEEAADLHALETARHRPDRRVPDRTEPPLPQAILAITVDSRGGQHHRNRVKGGT